MKLYNKRTLDKKTMYISWTFMINYKCYKIVTERWERMLNKFKKLGLFLSVTVTLVTIVPQNTYASLNVSKVNYPSEWAEDYISEAERKGLITDRIQGDYKDSITREEFSELAVILYETLSRKEVTPQVDNPFVDTNNPKIVVANQLGLVNGKGEGNFSPYGEINREEVSTVLYKTLQIAKPKYDYSEVYEQKFKDYNSVSDWAKEAVGYLYGIEVINADYENSFNPKGVVSREEAIVIIKRIHDKVIEADRASKNGLTISRGSVKQAESEKASQLKDVIAKQIGKPYKYGSAGPNSFDCSGLTSYVYKQLGITLPRTSSSQNTAGVYVAKEDLQYGDLIIFSRNRTTINHVGIYVGNGNFVHSPETGKNVRIETFMSGYYSRSYFSARRVLK